MSMIMSESFLGKVVAFTYQRGARTGKLQRNGVMEYRDGGVVGVSVQPSNTPLLQHSMILRLRRISQHQAQDRRYHQHDPKDRKRESVAAGGVKQESEKRRPGGGENLRNEYAHAANLAERQTAEITGP